MDTFAGRARPRRLRTHLLLLVAVCVLPLVPSVGGPQSRSLALVVGGGGALLAVGFLLAYRRSRRVERTAETLTRAAVALARRELLPAAFPDDVVELRRVADELATADAALTDRERRLALFAEQRAELAALGALALAERTPDAVLARCVRILADLLGVSGAAALRLGDGATLEAAAAVGEPQPAAVSAAVPGTLAGAVVATGAPVIVVDVATDLRCARDPLRDAGVVSALAVPIRRAETTWGVVLVLACARRSFSPADVDFVRAAANLLALSVDRTEAEAARTVAARILASVDDGVATLDRDLRVTSWSGTAARIYGIGAADAVGARLGDLVGEPLGGEHVRTTLEHRRPDGVLVTGFDLLLPLRAQAAPRAEDDAEERGPAGGSGTILLVEDEPVVREVVQRFLESGGYRVVAADGPEHALELADSEPAVDLLLTDVVMPQMTGTELAERVVARHVGVKVAFMSGYTNDTRPPGGPAFLQKPFSQADLLTTLGRLLTAA